MRETWRAVPIAPGYDVSDRGRVRSARRGRHRLLVATKDKGGYHRVALYIDGVRQYHAVHRLVLLAFVGPCPPGLEGRHLDDDPDNNTRSNVCWGTRLDNVADRRKNGGLSTGEDNGRSKLTAEVVREMRRRRRETGESYPKLARRYGVSGPTAYHACVGNTWKHITEDDDGWAPGTDERE